MGAGELARAPMKSCFSVVQVVFITKGGSVKNRDAPKGSESRFHPLGENRNPFKPLNIKAETAIKRFQLRRLG